jgi:hypothetical protein
MAGHVAILEDFDDLIEDVKEIYHCSLIAAEKSLVQGVFGSLGLVSGLRRLGDIVCIMHGSKTLWCWDGMTMKVRIGQRCIGIRHFVVE